MEKYRLLQKSEEQKGIDYFEGCEKIALLQVQFYRKVIKDSNNQAVINQAYVKLQNAISDFNHYQDMCNPW